MSVTTKLQNDPLWVTIEVTGRFDFSAYQAFYKAYTQYAKGEKKYEVDLSQTEYIDSSALGMLLQLREYSDNETHGVVLSHGSQAVKESLRVANFDKLFLVS